MTLMEEIMEKLGVKLNEKFSVLIPAFTCVKEIKGMYFIKNSSDLIQLVSEGYDGDKILPLLLNGTATIVKKSFRPTTGGYYYFVGSNGNITRVKKQIGMG